MNKLYEVVIENITGTRLTFVVIADSEQKATIMAYDDLDDWQKSTHRENINNQWNEIVRELTDDIDCQKSFMIVVD